MAQEVNFGILDQHIGINNITTPSEDSGAFGEVIGNVLDLDIDRDVLYRDQTVRALVERRCCLRSGNDDSKDGSGNGDELHVGDLLFAVGKGCE